MDEHDYFMIRIRRPAAEAPEQPLSGVLERLGTGEKKGFESDVELLRLVWPEAGLEVNVRAAGPESGNRSSTRGSGDPRSPGEVVKAGDRGPFIGPVIPIRTVPRIA